MFEAVKEMGYCITDKDKYIFLITIPVYILIAFISENSFLMIIPILASIIDGYGILKSKNTVVICGIISNTMWIIYDLYYFNYALAFSDFTIAFLNICILNYSYIKFLRRNNVYTVNRKNISMGTLREIYDLDKQYYDSKNCWDFETIKKIYQQEKQSYILVKDQNKIIGYINILSLKKDVYDTIMNSKTMYDTIKKEDIVSYSLNKKNYYLSINSIVLKNEYQNKDTMDKILHAIRKFIKNKEKNGYHIVKINSYTINEFELSVIEKLNFLKVKTINNECILHEQKLV